MGNAQGKRGGGAGGAGEQRWAASAGVRPKPLPSLCQPRSFHAAVVTAANEVVVVGGADSEGFHTNTVQRLKQGDSAWQDGGSLETSRLQCGACAVGNTVVVAGGYNGAELDLVESLNLDTGTHKTLPALPTAVSGCGVVSVQGKVLVTGGFAGAVSFREVWSLEVNEEGGFSEAKWTPVQSMAQARGSHGIAAGDGAVFVCGGVDGTDFLDSCEMLQVGDAQAAWKPLPRLPVKIRNVACCYGGGNVFAAGGNPSQIVLLALRRGAKQWKAIAKMSIKRDACAVVCMGRRVMVLGGHSSGGSVADCEEFGF